MAFGVFQYALFCIYKPAKADDFAASIKLTLSSQSLVMPLFSDYPTGDAFTCVT